MKITVIGAPPEDENGVRPDLKDEWWGYCNMVYAAAITEACWNEWVDGTYCLIPSEMVKHVDGREGWIDFVRAVPAAEIDRGYEWSADPEHPLRRIARAWWKERMAHNEKIEAIQKLVNPPKAY